MRIERTLQAYLSSIEPTIIGFGNFYGYQSLLPLLDELLLEAEQFNDSSIRRNLFLSVNDLCKKHKALIWSSTHRAEISLWLKKSRMHAMVLTSTGDSKPLFETTWDEDITPENEIPLVELANEIQPGKTNLKKEHTYEDLFINAKDAERSLDLLKDLEPPFIGEDNLWLNVNKGIWRLWLDILIEEGIIKPNLHNTHICSMLLTKITGMKLHSSELGRDKEYKQLESKDITFKIKILLSKSSKCSED